MIFDISGIYNDDGNYHYQWYHFAVRERMKQSNVMWRGNPVPLDKAWPAFVNWVEAIHADKSNRSPRAKTIANRPANLVDSCWKDKDSFTSEPQTFSREPTTACNISFPSFAFPRYVAGGPLAANIIKCQLRPVEATDYQIRFTPDQMARLRRIFPDGVCDFSKPGVRQVKVVPWASFGPAPENLVYDIRRKKNFKAAYSWICTLGLWLFYGTILNCAYAGNRTPSCPFGPWGRGAAQRLDC